MMPVAEHSHSVIITHRGNMNGERFLIDSSEKVVHDLFNVKVNCEINNIINASHEEPCVNIHKAHDNGVQNCIWCLGQL